MLLYCVVQHVLHPWCPKLRYLAGQGTPSIPSRTPRGLCGAHPIVLVDLSRKIYDIKRRSYSQPPEERISESGKESVQIPNIVFSGTFSSQENKHWARNMPLLVSNL